MQSVTDHSDPPVSSLLLTWILMIPLLCFAVNGLLWFRSAAVTGTLSATFGSFLATGATDTADNMAVAVLLFVIIPVALFPRIKTVVALLRRDKIFAALAGWILLSCLWSQFPLVSIQWVPVAVLNIVFAFYLYARFSPERQIHLFLVLGWVCLLLSITLSVFVPRYGIDYGDAGLPWRGIYAQKNMCSMVTVFLLSGAFYAPAKSGPVKCARVVYISLSGFLILMTGSVTGRITLTCLVLYLITTKALSILGSRERTVALLLGVALALIVGTAALFNSDQIALSLGKDPTLTGRTEIWHAVMTAILKRPIVGYGYNAFWRSYQGESATVSLASHWAVSSAHNAFLEIWLTLGAVGVILVLYSLFRAIRSGFVCLREGDSPYLEWYACIVFLTIITGIDEGILLVPNNLLWILYILACIGLYQGARLVPGESTGG